MNRLDRREKLALDEAYKLFRLINRDEQIADTFQLVRCLKTISNALNSAHTGQLQITVRLWQRIQQALFDKLITSVPGYIVVYDADGRTLATRAPIPEDAIIELHPEGLKRSDDAFQMAFEHLHPVTRNSLIKVWLERGPYTKRDDFANFSCGDACPPKLFVLGDDLLRNESQNGKEKAYKQWWELYWQAYCSKDRGQRNDVLKQMQSLESVWGDLYY
jgi:hypothetical protein